MHNLYFSLYICFKYILVNQLNLSKGGSEADHSETTSLHYCLLPWIQHVRVQLDENFLSPLNTLR